MNDRPQNHREPAPWLDADEIKRRVDITTVLDRYNLREKLKGTGAQLTGHSPFRPDERPSFSVNLEKGVWNDMGGRPVMDGREVPGNVIGLVMAMEKCSFRDALVKLSDGIAPKLQEPAAAVSQETRGRTQEALRKEDAKPTENTPFGKELGGLRTADLPYFQSRGITEETVKAFGAGYCSRGLMKGRIVFPIRDVKREVLAYAGRAARDDQEPKYRFPSGFKKQLTLYNIDRIAGDEEALKAVRERGIILVEGFSDVLKVAQEGFPNVVGLMGSDFHDAQRALLLDAKLNPTRRVALFLDNDEAGQKARQGIAKALIQDAFVRYVDYGRVPKGKHVERPTEPEHFTRKELLVLLGP